MLGFLDPNDPNSGAQALLTQEQLAAQQRVAQSLIERAKRSRPMTHWTQALAQGLEGVMGGYEQAKADQAAARTAAFDRGLLSSGDLSAPGSTPPSVPTSGGGAPSAPKSPGGAVMASDAAPAEFGDVAPRLKGDLMRDFGLQPHQAGGIVGNLAHESGGFKELQELKPLVPGSRGGFGYAQWTGPRRKAFEAWSAENGMDPRGYDANYGFLKHELAKTPEGSVLAKIRQAPDARAATEIFSNDFLRPGIVGMGSRMNWTDRVLRLAGQQRAETPVEPQRVQMAAGPAATMSDADPIQIDRAPPVARPTAPLPTPRPAAFGAPGTGPGLTAEEGGALAFAPQMQPGATMARAPAPSAAAPSPAAAGPTNSVAAVAAALAGRQGAPAAPAATPGQSAVAQALGVNPRVLEAATSPYASPATKQVAGLILRQQIEASQKNAEYNRPDAVQQRQLTIEGQRLTNDKTRRDLSRVETETMTAPNGQVFEREKGKPGAQWQPSLTLPQKPADPTVTQRELADENAARAQKGQPPLSMLEYRTQIGRASAPSVNIDQKQESEFGKETGKALAKRFDAMATEGDEASQNMALVTELKRLGGKIDFGAPAVAKQLLGRVGIKTEGVSDIEAFDTLINRLTPQQRVPGSGATSDFDAKMFRNSLPQLMNTPEGNALVISTIEKLQSNKIARGDIAMRVQIGELKPSEGIAEIRKLQAEARAMSDAVKDFGKPKAAPGAAQAPASTGMAPAKRPADKDPLGLFQ